MSQRLGSSDESRWRLACEPVCVLWNHGRSELAADDPGPVLAEAVKAVSDVLVRKAPRRRVAVKAAAAEVERSPSRTDRRVDQRRRGRRHLPQ